MPELQRGANGQIEVVPKILPFGGRPVGPAQPHRPSVEAVRRPRFGLPRHDCRPDDYGR